MIKPAKADDIDFLLAVARARYPAFDEGQARLWLMRALTDPNMLVVRGDYGGGVAIVTKAFWGGAPKAHMLFTCALPNRKLEGYFLLKAMDEWRKKMGAESLHFGSDTGVDFGPIAKRLGAVEETVSYRIDGGHVAKPASSVRVANVLEYALSRVA